MSQYRSQVHPLFPTPVGSYKGFSKQNEIKESLLDLLSSNEARPNTQDPNLRHWFDSSVKGVLDLEDSLLQALKSWVLHCAVDFVQEIEGCHCNEMQVISSWCNCADKGASQAPHRHENSWISGTYYIAHEEGHAPIQFWKSAALTQPNSAFFSLARKTPTVFNTDVIQISPSSGTLLLWPSHLLHGYSENLKDGRLSLSMNLLPKNLIGTSYSLSVTPLKNRSSI